MTQADQFPADVLAPLAWVREVEGKTTAGAHWEDGSYGNDAAPSWILVDDSGVVHAQAFYYAPANAERFEKRFGDVPYFALSILRDEEIVASCVLEPAVLAAALSPAHPAAGAAPVDALLAGLRDAGSIFWDEDMSPVSPA